MADEIIDFYKKATEPEETVEPIVEQKETPAPIPTVPSEPFDRFLFELADKLKNEKKITEQEQQQFNERVTQPTTNPEDPFARFLESFAGIVKEDKNINREENIKNATINFINNLKNSDDFFDREQAEVVEEPKEVKQEKKKNYLPPKFTKKIQKIEKPVIEQSAETVEEPTEQEPPKPENAYVQELKTADKSKLSKVEKKISGLTDIKKIIAEQVNEYLQKHTNLGFSGGGGGTVAVQYADGGTMNGDLNVTGKYLSGGQDLSTIFAGGGGPAAPGDRLISGPEQFILDPDGKLHSLDSELLTLQSESSALSAFTKIILSPYGFFAYDGNSNSVTFDSITDDIIITSKDLYEWTFNSEGYLVGPTGTLAVSGNVNTTGVVYASGGNSNKWNTAYNTATAYSSVSSSFVTKNFVTSNFVHLSGDAMTGGLTATNFKAPIFYGTDGVSYLNAPGGQGGSISLVGGEGSPFITVGNAGSISLNGGGEGCNAGSLISDAGSGNLASGGTLNMSGGLDSNGGSIFTQGYSAPDYDGGSINTSGGAQGAGGSINTSNGGGSISTNFDDSNIYPQQIKTGQKELVSIVDAPGGYIDTRGSLTAGGYINTSAGGLSPGGYIATCGSDEFGEGGYIDTRAYDSGSGGGPGGYINTSGGGGSIDTRGVGAIEFGELGTRTTLVGGAAVVDRIITLPDKDGTVALLTDIGGGAYLPLSGGTVSGPTIINNNLTVTGNITALGTATFNNTVFTVSSALSVVNVGPGPALFVSQSPGNFDVASFYDQDGIEVLHVGNAPSPGTLAKVGVNESFPNKELTVRGSVSATEVIYASGGSSNNWNTAYTSVQSNSASWFEPVRKFDYTTVLNVDYSYSGTAPYGTADNTPIWKLIRLTYANNGSISNSASAINSWTGRLTAAYV